MKGSILAVALATLALSATAPDAQGQAGKRYYCGPNENTSTCGPAMAPGIASSCAGSGCHARNPLADAQGRVMRAAGSVSAILGSPDAGMQAILNLYTPGELDAIAAWLLTLAGGASPPSCSVAASTTAPAAGSTLTLTATCTNAPTSYAWTNCSSTASTCTTSQATAGSRTYSVTAANANGASAPASVTVNWSSSGGGLPICSVSASNITPAIGTSITLTASCTNAPTSYAWANCISRAVTCTVSQTAEGSRTYSVTATNASGASAPARVTVNWSTSGGPPPPPPPPPTPTPPTTLVVEYLHAGFGHYFITSFEGEITALDGGQLSGWARTGRSFSAYTQSYGPERAVCRFFTAAFAPKSSHFYTPSTDECNGLRTSSRDWQYEADSFYVVAADLTTGSCPAGTQAVYRLYNNGQSGAPNHRYTPDPALRTQMMGTGWIPEGYGPEGVAFCAPI